jgi:hypothetical protein
VTGAELDTEACARRKLADDLLGVEEGRATERFVEAVAALAARAEDRAARRVVDVEPEVDLDVQVPPGAEEPPPEPEDEADESDDDRVSTTPERTQQP